MDAYSGYTPHPSPLAHGVSKWAVRGLTQASAIELAPHDIAVNACCSGMVKTNVWVEIDESFAEKHGLPAGRGEGDLGDLGATGNEGGDQATSAENVRQDATLI